MSKRVTLCGVLRFLQWCAQDTPASLVRAGVNLQGAPQLTQTFSNAEQAKSAGVPVHHDLIQGKANAVVFHSDEDLVIGPGNGDLYALGLAVLDNIGQQLAHTAKQQGPDVVCQGLGQAIIRKCRGNLVFLFYLLSQPVSQGCFQTDACAPRILGHGCHKIT